MDVVLVDPPIAKSCEPLLGTATLKAWLGAHGVSCAVIDANAEAQEWLLQAERVDGLLAAAPASHRLERRARSWPTLRGGVERLKRSLRTWEAYETPNRHRTAATSLNRVMAIAGAAFQADQGSPVTVSLTDYQDARCCDMDSRSVADRAARAEDNLFYEYYSRDLIPRVVAMRPRVIGLSLIFRNQLLCGAVLARMLKAAIPEALVILGGELVSAWAPILEQTALMELADAILPYEGEHGLLALARGAPPEAVPNLCWRDASGRVRKNPTARVASLGDVPAPDYTGAPWDLYFAPERTAPLVTARGCYWNKCTFCPEVVNPETRLRLARVDRVGRDLDALHDQHGITLVHFIDSALPPKLLSGVAEHVAAGSRPIQWYGFSRLETTLLRPGLGRALAAGGCRMLKLGLETASQELLDRMDKGQEVETVAQILRTLHESRILVHAFLMFGTPFEQAEDADATRRFIAQHGDAIQFANISLMNLAKGSPMALAPPAHGIRAVHPFTIRGHTLDLALYDNFTGAGWGRLAARRWLADVFQRDPAVRAITLATPAFFDSNHSVFFHRAMFGQGTRRAAR